MGKYMRKCKGVEEIAVMEVAQVGVRTRARALAMATASSGMVKRRKVGGGELKLAPSLIQLRSRRGVVVSSDSSASPAVSANSSPRTVASERSSSPSSDHIPESRCSSYGSSELPDGRSKCIDLKEETVEIEPSANNFECRERRETTPSSELRAESANLESTEKPSAADSRRTASAETMPSKSEIEEFFEAAEKNLQKLFEEKYNYDFAKDAPLEGRYEWIRLRQ